MHSNGAHAAAPAGVASEGGKGEATARDALAPFGPGESLALPSVSSPPAATHGNGHATLPHLTHVPTHAYESPPWSPMSNSSGASMEPPHPTNLYVS
jgi:hypothetical protein